MTKSVRYQKGQLYPEHSAWFVRYRERRRQQDGSIKNEREVNAWAVCRITRRNRRLNRCELPSCRR
jgi:hypothetical protein